MRVTTLSLLILAACLTLALLAGCKEKAPRSQDQPIPREVQPPISREPVNLEEAIRLYNNPASVRDLDTAVKLFYKYAYLNDPEGQYRLGVARWEGKGSDQSDLEAYVWWTIAARQHHLEAMNRIEDVKTRFTQEWLDEITNRANDWEEKVRATPEMHQTGK